MSKLKERRMKAGMSQSQLAAKSGIKIRVLQHYEQQTKSIDRARIDKIIRLSMALQCKISDILEDKEYIDLYLQYHQKMEE